MAYQDLRRKYVSHPRRKHDDRVSSGLTRDILLVVIIFRRKPVWKKIPTTMVNQKPVLNHTTRRRQFTPSYFLLFSFGLLWLSPSVFAAKFQWICDISNNPIVELDWHSDSSVEYTKAATTDADENEAEQRRHDDDEGYRTRHYRRRHLRDQTMDFPWPQDAVIPYFMASSSASAHRRNNENVFTGAETDTIEEEQETSTQVVQTRLCHCGGRFPSEFVEGAYCPIAYNHCIVSLPNEGSTLSLGCFKKSRSYGIIGGIWPLVIISFAVIFAALFGTARGWHAVNYGLGLLNSSRNLYLVDYLLRRNRYLASLHIRSYLRDHESEYPDDYLPEFSRDGRRRNNQNSRTGTEEDTSPSPTTTPAPPPNQLALKTRIYCRRADTGLTTETMSTTTSLSGEETSSQEGETINKDSNNPNGATESRHSSTSSTSSGLGDRDSDFDDLEHACAICFAELLQGDRVGALKCQHNFHVECLKDWLTCRNVCPLCLEENVATPYRQDQHLDGTTTNTSIHSNISHNDSHNDDDDDEATISQPVSADQTQEET